MGLRHIKRRTFETKHAVAGESYWGRSEFDVEKLAYVYAQQKRKSDRPRYRGKSRDQPPQLALIRVKVLGLDESRK